MHLLREDTHAVFDSTQWSLVKALGDTQGKGKQILDRLIRQYWPPVYALIRKKGYAPNEAGSLTLSFFEDVIFTRKLFNRADARKGKLRSLLSKALQNYLTDEVRKNYRERGHGLISAETIEQEEQIYTLIQEQNKGDVFDKRWAINVLELALTRCCEQYETTGQSIMWQAFEEKILIPAVNSCEPPGNEELAKKLGMENATRVYTTVRSVRKRLLAVLRDVVAETVTSPEEVEAEVKAICEYLSL